MNVEIHPEVFKHYERLSEGHPRIARMNYNQKRRKTNGCFANLLLHNPGQRPHDLLPTPYMGAVLKPLFTFYIKQEHVRSKIRTFLWSRKIRESTAKGPAKG